MNFIKKYLTKLAVKTIKLADPELTYGIISNVGSVADEWFDYHVLMIDYDDVLKLPALIQEVKLFQKKYNLSHAHIVESSPSPKKYHVFFFGDVLNYFVCCEIIHEANCCKFFKKQRMITNHITIRFSPKTYGDSLKPRLVHIELNCPVHNETYKYLPDDIKDEARKLEKFYLSQVDYVEEVLVNG